MSIFATVSFSASLLGLFLGSALLFLYLNKVEGRSTLFFSFLCFGLAVHTFSVFKEIGALGFSHALFWARVEHFGTILSIIFYLFFIHSFLGVSFSRSAYFFLFINLILIPLIPTNYFLRIGSDPSYFYDIKYAPSPGPAYFVFSIFTVIILIYGTLKFIRYRSTYKFSTHKIVQANFFIIGTVLTMFCGFNDLMGVLKIKTTISMVPYGFSILCLLFSYWVIKQEVDLYRNLKKSYFSTISALAKAIDERDPNTYGHSARVSEYAMILAENFTLSEDEKETIYRAALLHDIGKIGVPDRVLFKPSHLNKKEWEHIRSHPFKGSEIIYSVDFLKDELNLILYHHERYDGKGYPSGLKAGEIPLGAQIISISDTFDAMTSNRAYRNCVGYSKAFSEIEINSGSQFNPEAVKAFMDSKEKIIKVLDKYRPPY